MVHRENAHHTHCLIYICTHRYACSAIIAIKYVATTTQLHLGNDNCGKRGAISRYD